MLREKMSHKKSAKKLRRRKLLRNFIFFADLLKGTDDVGYHTLCFIPFLITAKILHRIAVFVFEPVGYDIPETVFFRPCAYFIIFFQLNQYRF